MQFSAITIWTLVEGELLTQYWFLSGQIGSWARALHGLSGQQSNSSSGGSWGLYGQFDISPFQEHNMKIQAPICFRCSSGWTLQWRTQRSSRTKFQGSMLQNKPKHSIWFQITEISTLISSQQMAKALAKMLKCLAALSGHLMQMYTWVNAPKHLHYTTD